METEVLRIEGNVTVPLTSMFEADFNAFMRTRDYSWSGNIVPQDDETGMRLYKVAEIDALKEELAGTYLHLEEAKVKINANNEAFLSLSEELTKERESKEKFEKLYLETDEENDRLVGRNMELIESIAEKDLIIQSLRNKDTRWRTFTKWFKEECLIHWFKRNR